LSFVESFEDTVSVNQQTAIAENLRVIFERYNNKKEPWNNFANVVRAEMQYSVTNTSRILDRRSRARSQQFDSYGIAGEPAKIQIFGKYYTFNEIINNQLDYDRYSRSWNAQYGRSIARNLLYTGRTPLYTWFKGPIGRDKFKFNKALEKFVREKIPGGAAWLDKNKPTEGMIQSFVRKTNEAYRRIIDLEFLFQANKKKYLDELAEETIGGKEAINVITKAIGMVADGSSTDYDSLAINIGKMLRKEYKLTEKYSFPFFDPTLKDYHRDGSLILTALKEKGYIRVLPRGKTRRSVIDLETGRASGPWRDTVSREVTILNKDMLELQQTIEHCLLHVELV